MALCEGGLPYALRVMCEGVIETLGKMSFEGEMKTAFTAHPKAHISSGKLYGFGYQVGAQGGMDQELLRLLVVKRTCIPFLYSGERGGLPKVVAFVVYKLPFPLVLCSGVW